MSQKRLILFVHGYGGHPRGTWERFPDLIRADAELGARFDVSLHHFHSSILNVPFFTKAPPIHRIAQGLRAAVDNRYAPRYSDVVLVAHSLGGLVVRRYICDELPRGGLHTTQVMLFAVPNNGSSLARLAASIHWWHRPLVQLRSDSEFLETLNSDWASLKVNERLDCRFVVGGVDQIVDFSSGRLDYHTDPIVLDGYSHFDIVKPTTAEDLNFLVLRNFLLEKKADSRRAPDGSDPSTEDRQVPAAHLSSEPRTRAVSFPSALPKEASESFDAYKEKEYRHFVRRMVTSVLCLLAVVTIGSANVFAYMGAPTSTITASIASYCVVAPLLWWLLMPSPAH